MPLDDEIEDPMDARPPKDDDALNHRQCMHCDLWFRFDEAKPAGKDSARCPNCGWIIERSS
jgi:uncharacterized paraquat-inducible protein A